MTDNVSLPKSADDVGIADVLNYYRTKIAEHGPVPQGVGWNSVQRQDERFRQLVRCFADDDRFSLLDLGCGYGAFWDFVSASGKRFEYLGTDISEEMIQHARALHYGRAGCRFDVGSLPGTGRFDYIVASGIFNIMFAKSWEAWQRYVFETMTSAFARCDKACAWNFLTCYADAEKMSSSLYYADPREVLDFCIRNLSKDVTLYHHYGIWDFTICVTR